jgi:hypothetical protein
MEAMTPPPELEQIPDGPPAKPGRKILGVALLVVGLAGIASTFGGWEDRPSSPTGPAQRPERPDSAAPPVGAAGSFELTHVLDVAPGTLVTLDLDRGDLVVRPSEDDRVHVRLELENGATVPGHGFRWRETRDAGRLNMEIRSPKEKSWFARLFGGEDSVEIEGETVPSRDARTRVERVFLDLPAGVGSELQTGAGDVDIQDIAGQLGLITGAGDVTVTDVASALKVVTGAGRVEVQGAQSDVAVTTGAGSIRVQDVRGRTELLSGAGDIELTGSPTSVSASTGAGGIEATLGALSGDSELETGLGPLRVTLLEGVSCSLEAQSGMGDSTLISGGEEHRSRKGNPLVRRIGDGGPQLKLMTSTGTVRVESFEPSS